ncbi:hypothetical protein C7S15_8182 [Burkholderia cepacia]|nr:hypothetical protein [Burkholderia cepacia]
MSDARPCPDSRRQATSEPAGGGAIPATARCACRVVSSFHRLRGVRRCG